MTAATILGGGIAYSKMNGVNGSAKALMSSQPALTVAGAAGLYLVYYQMFAYMGGFNQNKWNEYRYARLCRQVRNAKIQQ